MLLLLLPCSSYVCSAACQIHPPEHFMKCFGLPRGWKVHASHWSCSINSPLKHKWITLYLLCRLWRLRRGARA